MARSLFLSSSLSSLSQLLFPTFTIKSPSSSPFLALHSSLTSNTHLSTHSSPAAHQRHHFPFLYFAVSSSFSSGLSTLDPEDNNWDPDRQEALLRGGEQVTSVLEEIIKLLEDMDMDEASEAVAVEIAAHGVIGKRVDEMESGFMMALDYMIQLAETDSDDKVTDEMPHPVCFVLG